MVERKQLMDMYGNMQSSHFVFAYEFELVD